MKPFPRCLLVPALVAGVLAAGVLALGLATQARAQANPSADQIMRSLQPTGGLGSGGRGIRPVSPGAPAPSAAIPAATPGAPRITPGAPHATARHVPLAAPSDAAPAAPSVNLTVQFASGSAELTPAAVRTLTELGRALSSATLGSYRFRIEGHTDTVGTPESNKTLSEHRAQAVVTFLASRFGIEASRLDAVGMGEDGLLVQTPAGASEPRNRRVQVINLGA